MNPGIIANILIIVMELVALYLSPRGRGVMVLIFYTQISNLLTTASSILFIALGERAALLRYVSTCMLTMTFFVTLFILVPMGGGFKKLMLERNGLFHHTLCPVLSVLSYILWEPHSRAWYVPVAITLVYGLVMVYLNYVRAIDGPYPFFRVHCQSRTATVLWIVALLIVVTVISVAILLIAG